MSLLILLFVLDSEIFLHEGEILLEYLLSSVYVPYGLFNRYY